MDWQEINSAPRDGTVIEVCALDGDREGPFRMRWGEDVVNSLVGSHAGMWVSDRGGFTWDESRGFGPTHWRPVIRVVQ